MNNNTNTSVEEVKDEKKVYSGKSSQDKKFIRGVIVGIVIVIILACSGCLAWRYFNDDGRALEQSVSAQLGQLENKSNAEIEAELNKIIEKGSMSISINANPVFVTGTSEGNLQIENSPANHYGQEVVITIMETGEEVYRSGLILPNYHIQNDKLAVDLDAGNYDCMAVFTGYEVSEDGDYTEIGTAAAQVRITVIS